MYIDWKTNNENFEVLKFKREEESNDLSFNNSYIPGEPAVTFNNPKQEEDDKDSDTDNTKINNSEGGLGGFNEYNITNGRPNEKAKNGSDNAKQKSPMTNKTRLSGNISNDDREKTTTEKEKNEDNKKSDNGSDNNHNESIKKDNNIDGNINYIPDSYTTISRDGNRIDDNTDNDPSSVNYLTYILISILILVSIGFFSVGVFVYHNKKSKRKQNLNNIKQSTLERISQNPADIVFVPNVDTNPTNIQNIPNNNYQEFMSNPLNAEAFNSIPTVYVTTPQNDNDLYMEQKKYGYHPSKEEVEAYAELESKVDVKKLKALENSGVNY